MLHECQIPHALSLSLFLSLSLSFSLSLSLSLSLSVFFFIFNKKIRQRILDYNQIKSFIDLEIIGEEDKDKKYLFIFLLNTISIFYLKKCSTYDKLISTQFFLSIKIFYQLLNYNNLDFN